MSPRPVVSDPDLLRRVRVGLLRDLVRRGWKPPEKLRLNERHTDNLLDDIARIGRSRRGARPQNETLTTTAREREILSLSANGYTVDEIASELGRSRETIREAISSARARLGARNICHAVALALSTGEIQIGES